MSKFTLADLEKRVHERAKASAAESYTRALLDKGVAHCAKKLGEEAIETAMAAVQEDKRPPDRGSRRPALSSAGRAGSARRHAGRGRGRAGKTHRAIRPRRKRPRAAEQRFADGTAHRRNALALPHVLARGMGGVARGHADDADLGGGHAPALAARPARHQRKSRRFTCRCRGCCRCMWRRRSGCSARRNASSAPRTSRCRTSSASPARSRSANPPPRACCKPCWRAGRTCPRSISSPPTAFFIRTRSSSAKA